MFYIYKISNSETIDFAAEELKKYLRMMRPEAGDVIISFDKNAKDGFRLGLMSDFGLDTSDVSDVELDDIIYIDTKKNTGIIAGSNPRSVLIAVYEYLKKLGCAFYFPGIDGEYIPVSVTTDATDLADVKHRFVPTSRYRGQSVMNPDSDYIDFLPKLGMNCAMIEFKLPTTQFPTYAHTDNTENFAPEKLSREQVLQWKRMCETEVAKRGLQFHDIGHGFIVDAFSNTPILSADSFNNETLPENIRPYIAMRNGERTLFQNATVYTNFCMSNPEARAKVINYICNYADNHKNITHLHVWLADGHNNHCECDECRKMNPSDWYMVLMNELDVELDRRNNDMKIVFISYVDTLWAPLKEKIKNPKRFALLFAPIFRNMSETLPDPLPEIELEPYVLNQSENPRSLYEALLHLKNWEKAFPGDTVSFEYHFWRHQTYDMTGLQIAKRLYDDIRAYEMFGVKGIIQCASPCNFFPTGLAYYVGAKALYDKSLSFDEIAEEYLYGILGEDWREIYEIFEKVSEMLPFDYVTSSSAKRRDNKYVDSKIAKGLELGMQSAIEAEKKFVEAHYNGDRRVRTVAIRLLEKHTEYLEIMYGVFLAKSKGEDEKAQKLFEEGRIKFGRHEPAIRKYFNHSQFFGVLRYCTQLSIVDPIFAI